MDALHENAQRVRARGLRRLRSGFICNPTANGVSQTHTPHPNTHSHYLTSSNVVYLSEGPQSPDAAKQSSFQDQNSRVRFARGRRSSRYLYARQLRAHCSPPLITTKTRMRVECRSSTARRPPPNCRHRIQP
jgi:hypothetical protein